MEHQSHGSPSFINIVVLLLFAVVIAVASTATTYYFLSSKTSEQSTVTESPVIPPVQTNNQTNIYPTAPSTTQTTVPSIQTANWKVYKNEKYGYEMKYPANWIFNFPFQQPKSPPFVHVAILYSVPPDFVVQVTVSTDSLEKAIDSFAQHTSYRTETNRENILLNNLQAIKIQYKEQLSLQDKEYVSFITSIFVKYKNLVYHIRQDELLSKDHFSNQIIFDQILSTFKFTN